MRKNNKRGFTMAEMLIVVAIIIVLAGVAFIAVQNHQRSLAQSERNTIAKEIYFAAQNHLTMAESQGYLSDSVDSSFFGNAETAAQTTAAGSVTNVNTGKIYYAVANGASSFNSIGALELMLPFGSIDETVRTGGSYIIRYQANPAIVLDVFYCTPSGQPERFNHTIASSEYSTFLGYKSSLPGTGFVVGWYGGAPTGEAGNYLKTPSVEVENAEKLLVKVMDYNKGDDDASSVKLIIKGVTSEAQAAFILDIPTRNDRIAPDETKIDYDEYTIILDDITVPSKKDRGWHFADLNNNVLRGDNVDMTGTFIPGEDIVVVAVSYSNSALTNIAYSNEITTNSLYADLVVVDEVREKDKETGIETITTPKSATAFISNIRHLENLDKSLSGWDVGLTNATQIENLDWSDFVTKIGTESVSVCKQGDNTKGTKVGCYFPVSNTTALTYDGSNKAISNIKVDTTGTDENALTIDAGGIFGTLSTGSAVKNLEIKDATVTLASGDAGALVGKLVQDTAFGDDDEEPFNISNVVAYHTDGKVDTAKITTASGNAGGLIGQTVGGNCTIQKSAAALIVSATGGNAGGLIGTSAGGAVSGCYAGGHTKEDTTTKAVLYDSTNFNVTATATGTGDDTTGGVAGGLIGDAGSTEIKYSYSTCSAKGVTVGGLIGTGSGAIEHAYCTGLVKSTATTPVEGAFAGTYTGTPTDNHYFDIINERDEKDDSGNLTGGYTYLYPVSGKETVPGVAAIDDTASTFNDFCGASTDWKPAMPYDTKLKDYYGEGTDEDRVAKYNLKTIAQLDAAETKAIGVIEEDTITTPADFVATHYGDWPAPEIFVVNTK